jgi:hypothetical protein
MVEERAPLAMAKLGVIGPKREGQQMEGYRCLIDNYSRMEQKISRGFLRRVKHEIDQPQC